MVTSDGWRVGSAAADRVQRATSPVRRADKRRPQGRNHFVRLGRLEEATNQRISGWAFDTDSPSLAVDVLLDGRPFVTLRANANRPDLQRQFGVLHAGFYLEISPQLAVLLPEGSRVTVQFQDGEPLQSAKVGTIGSATPDLFALLARGWRVSPKSGNVYRPISEIATWHTSVAQTYPQARSLFRREFGRELFVSYGTLLGFIRDSDFLAHDDDIDVAFLCRAETIDELARDFVTVAARLRSMGLEVEVLNQGSFHLRLPKLHPCLDVFTHGLVAGRLLTYQVYAPVPPDTFEPFTELEVQNTAYALPHRPETLLTSIYGEWETPDPYFQWRTDEETRMALQKMQHAIAKWKERLKVSS
jgi:hypothetical protein